MQVIIDTLSWFFLVGGGLAVMVGALGLIRLPDFYTRLHAAGIIDTLSVGMIMLGLALQAGFSMVTVKLVLMAGFIIVTSPTSTHALAKSALHGKLRPIANDEGGASSTS